MTIFHPCFAPADQPGGTVLPNADGGTDTPTSAAATSIPPTSSASSGSAGGGASGTGGATALFPCLVYYPGSQNYSLIWVPMDGSNPIVSGANILSGSGTITLPTQVCALILSLSLSLPSLSLSLSLYLFISLCLSISIYLSLFPEIFLRLGNMCNLLAATNTKALRVCVNFGSSLHLFDNELVV